jgi:toxin-antitoxin system PIN domain toxin
MTRTFLLDVNVLVALFDRNHIHHESAHRWFATNRSTGWATCPLTENSVIRVLSSPAYESPPYKCADIRSRLDTFCRSGGHLFWPCSVSLRDDSLFDLSKAGHRQLTDIYLLGLAVRSEGALATFDTAISTSAVVGAGPKHLSLLPVV